MFRPLVTHNQQYDSGPKEGVSRPYDSGDKFSEDFLQLRLKSESSMETQWLESPVRHGVQVAAKPGERLCLVQAIV